MEAWLQLLFDEAGIELKPGQVEIFPGIGHLRLPFGRDSLLLDPETLKTIGLTLKGSLDWIREHPKIDLGPKSEVIFESPSDWIKPIEIGGSKVIPYSIPDSVPPGIYAILDSGIAYYGTRHELQNQLIRYYMLKCGLKDEEIEAKVLFWYNSHDHKSKDWEKRPDSVKKEVKAVIKNLRSKPHIVSLPHRHSLTTGDIKSILLITKIIANWSKAQYDREAFLIQLFLYDLISIFKKSKELDLSFSKVLKLNGASKFTASRRISFCEIVGLLSLVRPHDREKHICRRYRINYDFKSGKTVHTLPEGLMVLYNRHTLKHLYSWRIYKRVIGSISV